MLIWLNKSCSPGSVSVRGADCWPLLCWGPASRKGSVLPTGILVAELGGLSLLIPAFSHPTESTVLTSEHRQHRPGVPKAFSSPRICLKLACPRPFANTFWDIYCCLEVFQLSIGFRCSGRYVLGTFLQGAGNDGLYPTDYRVSGGNGM